MVLKKYDGINDLAYLRSLNEPNREGFIVKFSNGMRVKIKFADYVRLHSIITNVSTKDIWKYVRDGKDINDLLDKVPDEFDAWVKQQVEKLEDDYNEILIAATNSFITINENLGQNSSKKDFALMALKSPYHAILFKMREKRSFAEIIWKMIEPAWSKPWRVNADDIVDN
jgi:hypothetical protein